MAEWVPLFGATAHPREPGCVTQAMLQSFTKGVCKTFTAHESFIAFALSTTPVILASCLRNSAGVLIILSRKMEYSGNVKRRIYTSKTYEFSPIFRVTYS